LNEINSRILFLGSDSRVDYRLRGWLR